MAKIIWKNVGLVLISLVMALISLVMALISLLNISMIPYVVL